MYFFYGIHPFLIAVAVIPAIVLLIWIYRADRVEKEPTLFLLTLVILGAISTVLAAFAERLFGKLLQFFLPEGTPLYRLLFYFVVVGGAEEGAKYLILKLRTWKSAHFNCHFDGIVYAVFVSLGFALWENIGYVTAYGWKTGLLRAVTALPGHACFGVFMGLFYGLAKQEETICDSERSKHFLRLAVIIPLALHGCYDFIATLPSDKSSVIFLLFIAALFVFSVRTVKKHSKQDRYL